MTEFLLMLIIALAMAVLIPLCSIALSFRDLVDLLNEEEYEDD